MKENNEELAKVLPLLVLRDTVILPGISSPIIISREKSLNAIKEIKQDNHILIVSQKDYFTENPSISDLYDVGVLAKVSDILGLPNNSISIVAEAIERVEVFNIRLNDNYFLAEYNISFDDEIKNQEQIDREVAKVVHLFNDFAKQNKKISSDMIATITKQDTAILVLNRIASCFAVPLQIKQALLEEKDLLKRTVFIRKIIETELVHLEADQAVQSRTEKQIKKAQRDYYLNEQMKAIQRELDGDDDKTDFADFENKIKTLNLTQEAKEKATSELKKLKSMNPISAESAVIRNYLEVLLNLPWKIYSKNKIDVEKTTKILNQDHYGLEKVKERIIEYVAVLKRSKTIKGPILCLVGPPGVGKTSLVKSIASSIGRKYAKFALGGVRDEGEIRGHRRTYIGSMPGRIINGIKKTKTSNPVMILDEIDKLSSDFRGDPSAALLEVLDPEQNKHFVDNYLEVEFDLSNVIFVCTANSLEKIPRPLMDRMEIINIGGYTEYEKIAISKQYLIPKQLELHNVKENEFSISDDAIFAIIRYYTRESGVRSLERNIGKLVRKVLVKLLTSKEEKHISIDSQDLEKYLGIKKYRFGLTDEKNQIGATNGLAYTETGGDLLTIEALAFPGKGEIKTTGKLGEVMKESAQAAYSCFRHRAESKFNLKYDDYKNLDIHIHVPEGAIPKDGPSAGTAIFTTIVSLMTSRPVKKDVAMTGEITLTGKVLPIGGLREKLLAAKRGGVKMVLIPSDNEKDLQEIPASIKDDLDIISISSIDEIANLALAY